MTAPTMTAVEQLWHSGWFERNAKYYAGRTHGRVDWQDIAQEGAIRAVKAEASFNPDVAPPNDEDCDDVALMRWVKFRARGGMADVLKAGARQRPWEHESMFPADQPPGWMRESASSFPLMDMYVSSPSAEDSAELVNWDEVGAEIRAAVETLTDNQRRYIMARYFESGERCISGHKPWALYALRMRLWHLKSLVR